MISVLLPESPAQSKGPSQTGKTGPSEAPGKEERFSSFLADDDAADPDGVAAERANEEDSLAATPAPKTAEALQSADALLGVKAESVDVDAADLRATAPDLLPDNAPPQGEAEETIAAAVKQGVSTPEAPAAETNVQSGRRTAEAADLKAEAQTALPTDEGKTLAEDAARPREQTTLAASEEAAPPVEGEFPPPKQAQSHGVPEMEIRASSTTPITAEANALAKTATIDTSTVTSDGILSIVQAPSTSSGAQVPTGMAPVTPAHVIAAPTELSNVILNALKGGVDPQEQLVVQLDPPELGRVTIDFKFDAQGVQQITISAENPEALKRLRELHFELTEALKDQGLSDQNMSFREETDQHSQSNWQGSERNPAQSSSFVADGPMTAIAAAPPPSSASAKDRLDLLL